MPKGASFSSSLRRRPQTRSTDSNGLRALATSRCRRWAFNRNFHNYMETFPFFAVAVLTAQAADVHNELTHWGSIAYLGGRIAYATLYNSRNFERCRVLNHHPLISFDAE